jgi:predicted transcriptional regulator YheO
MENLEELISIISSYPNRIDIICLNNDTSHMHENLNDLVKINGNSGKIYVSKNLDMNYLKNEIIQKLLEDVYEPQEYELKCGHLDSKIVLTPKPRTFKG